MYVWACLPVTYVPVAFLAHHKRLSLQTPLPFRSTEISNQKRFANMSEQSSSDNTSSATASSTSSSSSLQTIVHSSRPAPARDQSYTHVFPASRADKPAMSKSRTSTRRTADPPCVAARPDVQDDRTRLLFGGLQWLLDASVKSYGSNNAPSNRARFVRESSEPLSEKAITSHNAQKDADVGESLKPDETAAWIDGQRKRPAAPPF